MFHKTIVRGPIVAALRLYAGILILLGLLATHAYAQTLSVLASFNRSNGEEPIAGLTLSGNTLYGTASEGGANLGGVVFSLPVSGGTPTVLASFNSSNGNLLAADLMLSNNTLYGTASEGGAYGYGTIFSLPVSGGAPTVLGSFNYSNGASPAAGVTLVGNTLYGTTDSGAGDGTVFSLPMTGGTPTSLVRFEGSNGSTPMGDLTLIGNTLYGTTEFGGSSWYGGNMSGNGTVFSISASGGTPTTLTSFNGSNGENPRAGVLVVGNTLYGTTEKGGASGDGTVFSLPVSGGTPTVLASFNGSNGELPVASLTLSNNTLYGTTAAGGAYGYGIVFSLPVSGGAPTVLASFNGGYPSAGLTVSGNTLYGTIGSGGANGDGMVFALNIANIVPATIALANPQSVTIVTGGTGTLGMALSNATSSGCCLSYTASASVQSGNVTLLSNSSVGCVAPSTSQSCTFSATSTNLGVSTISFTASDPNSSNLSQTTTATLTVLGHTVPSLAVANGNNRTVIVGATGITAGLQLSNGTLNQTALASLDVNSLGLNVTGSTGGKLVASGTTQSYTGTLNTNTLGNQTQTFSLNVGDDHTLPGASSAINISTTATLTVFDHSNASLSPSAGEIAQTINFGSVLRGATIPNQSFTIYNLAANTSAAQTANLKLTTGFTTIGDPGLTTNLSAFNGLQAGSGSACTASLNTSNYTTTGVTTITLSASQLVDDSSLLGAGSNNDGTVTVTLQGNVGNATADASNSQTAFGAALTAPVAVNGSYANLESTVKSTSGSGGFGMVGSTATILAGTNSGSGLAQTVSMAWRTQMSSEGTGLVSDVLNLSGMALNGVGGQTSPFVLQMDYDPELLGGNEAILASEEMIHLEWLNPATNQWENAIYGNFGTNSNQFHLGAWPNGDMTLGDWGVNTANHTVWAVLDHNSDFAVVPEPSALALLAAGAIGLLGCAWRRRATRTAKPTAFHQSDDQAILSFPSHSSQANAARRAA